MLLAYLFFIYDSNYFVFNFLFLLKNRIIIKVSYTYYILIALNHNAHLLRSIAYYKTLIYADLPS